MKLTKNSCNRSSSNKRTLFGYFSPKKKNVDISDRSNTCELSTNSDYITSKSFNKKENTSMFENIVDINRRKDVNYFRREIEEQTPRRNIIKLVNIFTSQTYVVTLYDSGYKIPTWSNIVVKGTAEGKHYDLHPSSNNYLTIYPTHYLSITNVAIATKCLRQAIFNERLASQVIPSQDMLVGSLCHHLVERFLASSRELKILDDEEIFAYLNDIAHRFIHSSNTAQATYSSGIDENEILSLAREYYSSIITWCRKLKSRDFDPEKSFVLDDTIIHFDIIGVEEYVEDYIYGLKGKIDITVKVVHTHPFKKKPPIVNVGDILPIEIKTGKIHANGSIEHRAQVMMYSMLLENRYNVSTTKSILLYLKNNGEAFIVNSTNYDRHAFVEARNNLVSHLQDSRFELPDYPSNSGACKFCPVFKACHLHTQMENKIHPHAHIVPNTLNLHKNDIGLYKLWYTCIIEEIYSSIKMASQPYPFMTSLNNNNNFIYKVELKSIKFDNNLYELTFNRNESNENISSYSAISSCTNIVQSSYVVGYFIRERADDIEFQIIGIVHHIDHSSGCVVVRIDTQIDDKYIGKLFNIRLFTNFSTSYLPLTFLTDFFVDTSDRISHFRNCIINPSSYSSKGSSPKITDIEDIDVNKFFNSNMDPCHKRAINDCVNIKNYALLWGFPGTGKTTTISALVYIYLTLGKKVLISSHTNAAVDNILLKLLQHQVPFLRLGKIQSVHREVQPHTLEYILSTKSEWNKNDIDALMTHHHIFATTCFGVKNTLLNRIQPFDVCIIDEATQVNVPLILGSIKLSKSFILVGDHYQLSPLVISKKAPHLKKSLFEIFMSGYKNNFIELNSQFRMHPHINEISSTLFYNGKLKPSEIIRDQLSQKLELSHFEELHCSSKTNISWISKALAPSSHPAILINSSVIKCDEGIFPHQLPTLANKFEVCGVYDLVDSLVLCGISESDIGILSPFNNQVETIKSILLTSYPSVEVHTIDSFQGRDKLCIIISFVIDSTVSDRSIVFDHKRLNVAFTRAQKKLIIIGNLKFLNKNDVFKKLTNILEKYNAIIT